MPRRGVYPRIVTTILTTIAEAREALVDPRTNGTIALVPTMGALHEGHLSLVRLANEHADFVVVSIFVNPTQFGPGEDFDRYPRTFDEDVALLEGAGVDAVFAPAVDEMYPKGLDQTLVTGGPASRILEGAHRPGHFDGALTIVHKLVSIIEPDLAVFGEKDAQQLFLVRAMVDDLNLRTAIVGAPINREDDGLARSSRNRYLSAADRELALHLSAALRAADGAADADAARQIGRECLDGDGIVLDYFELVDPSTFLPVEGAHTGTALAVLAARVGTTRLIDNQLLMLGVSTAVN